METFFKKNWKYFAAGIIIGLVAIFLTCLGNPKNMGFCIACFLRDTAGGAKLTSAGPAYVRPEIIGIILGAFIMALVFKEFSSTGGSSPVTRFILGACIMTGALIFLGCPLRLMLRIAGGDLNAIIALPGFIAGIAAGVFFLNKGFTLKRSYKLSPLEGYAAPATSGLLLILFLVASSGVFVVRALGEQHAAWYWALLGGLVVGAVAQRARVCFAGGIRDTMMFKQFNMLYMILALLVTVLIGNLITGDFNFGMGTAEALQPVSHTDWIWNILGLFLVGLGSTLIGGCPMRQLVLAGSGNSDSTISVLGMIFGAIIVHAFGLASTASSAIKNEAGEIIGMNGGGATDAGKIAFIICMAVVAVIILFNSKWFTDYLAKLFKRNKGEEAVCTE